MSDLAVKHRKGARTLEIRGETWTWFRGKSFVEIRSPENKATLVRREALDITIPIYCGPDRGCGYSGCDYVIDEGPATLPGAIARYIRHVILAQ